MCRKKKLTNYKIVLTACRQTYCVDSVKVPSLIPDRINILVK